MNTGLGKVPEYKRNCDIKPGIVWPEGMQRMALALEYNGADFHGLQRQKSGVKTVQRELEQALSSIADETISIVCAGRTDAGVHATKQIIHFDTLAVRPLKAWVQGVNARLPKTICVRWAHAVSNQFHARYSALSRTYRYHIYNSNIRPALLSDQITWCKRPLDFEEMEEAGRFLVGEHDFSSFRSSQCQANTPIRNIEYIRWDRRDQLIIMEIKANAFLHHMVRNCVGSLMSVGMGEKPKSWIKSLLEARDRRLASATAPATGLYMVDVGYPKAFTLPYQDLLPIFLDCSAAWPKS